MIWRVKVAMNALLNFAAFQALCSQLTLAAGVTRQSQAWLNNRTQIR
jgi:hypothetical protein